MSIGIVVILYNPDVEHVNHLIDEFASDDWQIAIVDNSPHPTQLDLDSNCIYYHYPSNLGIAEAQNIGLRALFSQSIGYCFLLDQDSSFSPVIAASLYKQFIALEKVSPVAAIGPAIHCQFSNTVQEGVIQKGKQISLGLKEVKQIIASGMLISQQAFEKVGEKESALFIDGVDHEWCWRAKRKGLKVYQSQLVSMPHRQGDDRVKVLGITFKQGTPVRLYYQLRNVLILSRRRYVPIYWKCRHLFAIPLRYIVNRFVFENGQERGQFMRKGLRDGIKKTYGPLK